MRVIILKRMLIISSLLLIFYWSFLGAVSYVSTAPSLPISSDIDSKDKICYVNLNDSRTHLTQSSEFPIIYYVTPTYPRPEQIPELIRLSHSLMHVSRLHWIVADDQPVCSRHVLKILKQSNLPFTHLSSPKPHNLHGPLIARGVSNRLAALKWLRKNVHEGILYFGDDDNTVHLDLFDEIRKTKKVSMLPVGLIGDYGVSSPVIKNGKVVGFFDSWPASRKFPVDMAGFAVNLKHLKPTASMPYRPGYEEDKFLSSLGISLDEIEPLADNCSKVLVWHTRTVKYAKPTLRVNVDGIDEKYKGFSDLLKEISDLGMVNLNPQVGAKALVSRNNVDVKIDSLN